MNKVSLILALAIATAANSVPPKHASTAKPAKVAPAKPTLTPPPAPLPVFSFMGQDTETPTSMTSLNGSPCTPKGTQLECDDFRDPKIADHPMQWLSIAYNNGKLYRVMGAFGQYAYDPLREAFTAKYGAPAVVETRKWQSRAGATFDNLVAVWHFKGGDLELASMGSKVTDGSFVFVSTDNGPPADKPKVDF